MNFSLLRNLFLGLTTLAAFLLLVGCTLPRANDNSVASDDDDDVTANDDDAVDDDDDDDTPGPMMVAGSVVVVDRETGTPLTQEEYEQLAGLMVVYLVEDPADLSDPIADFVLAGPGTWSTTLEEQQEFYAVVVVDIDDDRVIEQTDLLREHDMNPRMLVDVALLDVDITVDLETPWNSGGDGDGGGGDGGGGGGGSNDGGSGGGGSGDGGGGSGDGGGDGGGGNGDGGGGGSSCTTIEGMTFLANSGPGEIAITASSINLQVGPFAQQILPGEGPFSLCVDNSHQSTAILGLHDANQNLLFEPSDVVGEADVNPITLGNGDVSSVVVRIPSPTPITLPSPPPYVFLEGDVVFPGYTTGSVLLFVSLGTNTYYSAEIAAPGPFTMRAPPNTEDVRLWAVVDEDGDGIWDLTTDPSGEVFTDTATFDLIGTVIEIDDPSNNAISGTIDWAGTVNPGNTLYVALHTELEDEGAPPSPVAGTAIVDPVFPQEFTVDNLIDGTYFVTAYLDYAGDGNGVEPNEPLGIYGGFGGQAFGVSVYDGSTATGIEFELVEPMPPPPAP